METCRIYSFDNGYSFERQDVENKIGEMLNNGWKIKHISSVIDGEVVLTVIYEKEDENNPQANCICDVDNEFDLYSIEHGTYTLVFHSSYPNPLSVTFTF